MVVPLLVSACASAPPYQPSPGTTISPAEREQCEAFAVAEGNRGSQATAREATEGTLIALFSFPPAIVLLPLGIGMGLVEVSKAYTRAHDAALQSCFEPIILAQTKGPDDPAVARSLTSLASRNVALGRLPEAEAQFRRALAIYERTGPGPDPFNLVELLQDYAALLRAQKREPQAAAMDARARSTRELHAPKASLSPRSHDFGSLALGTTSREMAFTLTNTGGRPFEIAHIRVSSGFLVGPGDCPHDALPAGDTCRITVTFAPYTDGAGEGVLTVVARIGGLSELFEASLTGTGTVEPTKR
jgi:hypothetical protein